MSGVEVAGLILGAFPLLLAALESYAEIIAPFKRARKYRVEILRIKHDLDAESAIFLDTLERLVDGLVLPKEFEELLGGASSELWQDGALEERFQARLGRSYPIYTDSVNDMIAIIQQFVDRLDLDEQGKPRWAQNSGLSLVSQRARFSLQKRAFAEFIKQLQTHNRRLEKLIPRSFELESSRRKRAHPLLEQYAECAFHALEASFGCDCSGTDCHTVLLGISSHSTKGAAEFGRPLELRVVISGKSADALGDKKDLSTWQELSLRAVEVGWQDANLTQMGQMDLSPVNSSLIVWTRPDISIDGQDESFPSLTAAEPITPSASSSIRTISSTSCSTFFTRSPSSPQAISRLCEVVRTRPSTLRADPGYIVDSNQKFLLEQIAHSDNLDETCWTTISLEHILEGSTNVPPLTPWNRITLSATLASAVLRLNGSPWLEHTWKNDIYFIQRPDKKPYREAFLAKKMLDSGKAPTVPAQNIYDDTLFALAVALIELSLGPFKKLQTQEDLNAGNIADLVTACRLVAEDKIMEQYGPRYQAAVERCIELAKSCKTWNEDVQQEMYEGVVSVLEDQAMRQNSVP